MGAIAWLQHRYPSREQLLQVLQRRLLFVVIGSAAIFSITWILFPSYRVYLVPTGTAAGALFGAIPGLISEKTQGRWASAMLGTLFVGVVTWYTTIDLDHKLETKRSELVTLQARHLALDGDVKRYGAKYRDQILVEAANILDEEWRTKVLAREFAQRDYSHIDDLINFISALDIKNGHALYYAGQSKRARKQVGSTQEDFTKYLEYEKGLPDGERGGSTFREVCYERLRGYCRQRTAWIQHLLANDFFDDAQKESHPNKRRENYRSALCYTGEVFKNFPTGFNGKGQGTPTTTIKETSEKEWGDSMEKAHCAI